MATISFGALTFGRQNTALFALFITGWGMVMYQPENLTGISFQLSFLSTLGIIMIKPLIERVFTIRFLGLVKDDLTTTLAAQIATFPLMIASFGAYSLLTLPVNLLILWTIPFLMILGVGSTILAIVVPLLAKPLILLSYPFLAYFAAVIDLSEKYKWVVEFDSIPGAFICGYYLIVIGIIFSLKNSERRRI
jgi:competence protein ComEC